MFSKCLRVGALNVKHERLDCVCEVMLLTSLCPLEATMHIKVSRLNLSFLGTDSSRSGQRALIILITAFPFPVSTVCFALLPNPPYTA